MLREGGHSVKEIAEAMGVTSLHEVSVLIEKYNEKQLAKGKPPAVLGGAVKIPQSIDEHPGFERDGGIVRRVKDEQKHKPF